MTPPKETTIIQPAPRQVKCFVHEIREEGCVDCRSETQPAPVEQDELVERVSRALYQCEKERSDIADAVISAAAGKTVSVGMEPWEECWQVFYSDARAVLAALSTLTPARAEGFKAGVEACKDKLKAIGFNNVDEFFADVTMEGDHG